MTPRHNMAAQQLLSQYESTWKMTRAAIGNIPDEIFTLFEKDWSYAITVYHIIETMDFYSRDDPDTMEWGKKAGYSWDNVNDIKEDILPLISRELLLNYLVEMEQKITKFLTSVLEGDFFERDGFHMFESVYQKYLYLLRHNQHHLGELGVTLRRLKAERIKWI
ncbi:MAG: hypothetical protein ACW98Y_10375 [Candidatus Thorarchaeota archaeon]|jgi:hypothetical protein